MNPCRHTLFLIAFLLLGSTLFSANRFWVGSGSWNNSSNWSTTSGGGGGASVPGSSDVAIFDGNGTSNCTIDVSISVNGFDIKSGYSGTITQSSGFTITIGNGDFSQAAGSFSGGDAAIDINSGGTFTLSGGGFTSTSDELSIGGSVSGNYTIVTFSGGTFTHNNGKVTIDPDLGGCATRTVTFTVSSSVWPEFYDFEVNVDNTSCNEDRFVVTSGDTIIVLNELTHTDGYIYSGVIQCEGDLVLNTTADGGYGTLYLTNTSNVNYTTSGSGRFPIIEVDKSSGTVSANGGTTELLCQGFYLYNGTFTAPTGTFNIGGAWGSNTTLLNHTGGTFNHNNGEVEIDPDISGCATRTMTITSTASPKMEFYDLRINVDNTSCNEDRLNIPSSDTMIVLNDFTHQDGFVNTGVVRVHGDIYLESGADGGSATIHINDVSANQEYYNTSTSRFAHIMVDKAAGTFTPGGGTTDFYCQQLSILSGSMTAPTGTIYIGGGWGSNVTLLNHSGGTFAHNNGVVRLDPDFSGCATRTATVSSSATPKIEFYDLYIDVDNTSCNEDRLNIPSGDTIVVLNDFTHQDGFVNTGVVRVLGDIYLESGADGGSATIYINDASANQEYYNTSTSRFAHIMVDKAAGTFTPGGATTDFYCQQLSIVSGSMTAPTGTIYIGGGWGSNVTLLNHSGGTFAHNNGVVRLDPDFSGCATRTATVSSSATPKIEFYDLFIDVDNTSCNEDRLNIPSGDTIVVLNDFTHQDGFVNTGVVRVLGDIYLESGADGGSATIYINDASANQEYYNTSTSRFAHIMVDKAAGTFTPGGATTDFYCQQLSIVNGSMTAPSGTLYIGGGWGSNVTLINHTGGTFAHNNGVVRLDPDFSGCATRTATVSSSVIPKIEFYDLYVDVDNTSCNEDRLNIPSGDTIVVLNDFTHQDGYINTGVVQVEGDIFMVSGADGGTATLYLTGTVNQEYTNTSTSRFPHIHVDKSSGSVSAAGGTTTIYMQQFTLESGTWNAPTTGMYVGGPWGSNVTIFEHSGGTFVNNSNTVYIDPDFSGCATRTATINVLPSTEFYNLYLDIDNTSCNEDRLTITSGDTLKAVNDLTVNDGQINTGHMSAGGNVALNVGYDGGSAQLIFTDGNNQTFDLTGGISDYNNDLWVNKTGGRITLLSDFTMDGGSGNDLNIINRGHFATSSSSLLIIGDNVDINGYSDSAFVDGPMRKIGNEAFTFPLGDIGNSYYAPLSISAPGSASDHFTAEYFSQNPEDSSLDRTALAGTLHHVSELEFWVLDRTNGSSNVSVTLSWDSARSGDVNLLSHLRVSRWDGSQWVDHGNGSTTGDTEQGTVTSSSAVSSFSPFTLASTTNVNALPVELISFDAVAKGDIVELKWTTLSEINNDYFVLERSQDAVNFIPFAQTEGSGNSRELVNYVSLDESPLTGTSYYRLKQVDFNGDFSYSDIVSVSFNEESDLVLYPNPSSLEKIYTNDLVTGRVFSQDGLEMKRITNSQSIDVSDLTPGIYYLKLDNGDVKKFIVQR